ncbi:MAG TPA: hypothetical protein VMU94_25620 [Streptosporangiaceae bacterium]|nr:hypothetical protein [Streptosporangiaceae bacterium]
MGRKSKTRPKRPKDLRARRRDSVEAFEAGGVTFVRDGKNIYASSSKSADEHREFLTAVREQMLPRLRDERQQLRDRLDEILGRADAVDLLARASFLYLPIDPDTYKEHESDRGSAHIEYLALQVLPNSADELQAVDPVTAASLTGEAIHLVRELFAVESQLLTFGQAEDPRNPDDSARRYQARTRLESMSVRGSGYAEHLRAILLGTLGQFDAALERLLGFTARQALDMTMAIVAVVEDRLQPIAQEAQEAQRLMLQQLPRQRRKGLPGPVPDWIVALKPTEAKRWISVITRIWMFAEARLLATVTPAEIAAASGTTEENARAFLEAFTCPPTAYSGTHHRLPVGAHPLTERPVLRVQGGYILPVPSSMVEALRPRMEDLLQQADASVWERYVKRRADYVEEEAVRRLVSALPGASGSTALKWKSASDESDLDGLVAVDDFALRLQGKAGRLHAPTRRGAPERMKQNLSELIKEAARQHAALADALDHEGAEVIGLGDHREALEEASFQIEVIVCLDDVTVWSTHSHELQQIDVLPRGRPIPWVLSLADLMAVTDLLQGAQLLHYIIRRLRLEAIGKIVAHDELDWVGYYIDRGLYFEDLSDGDGALDEFRLLSFTEPIDAWYFTREGIRTVPAPKPAQVIPPHLAMMVSRLEQERPAYWTIGAMALLMGDDDSRQVWEERLIHAIGRRFSHGWSNATQVFDGIAGVTYYIDYRTPPELFRTELAAYVEQKIGSGQAPNWIAIGDSGAGRLEVVVRSVAARSITEVFSMASQPSADSHAVVAT